MKFFSPLQPISTMKSWLLLCTKLFMLVKNDEKGKEERSDRGERGERGAEGQRERRRRKEKAGKPPVRRGAPGDTAALPPLSSSRSPLPPPCLTCASFSFSSLRVRAPPGSSVTFRITTLFFSQPMNEPSVKPSTTDRKSW